MKVRGQAYSRYAGEGGGALVFHKHLFFTFILVTETKGGKEKVTEKKEGGRGKRKKTETLGKINMQLSFTLTVFLKNFSFNTVV